MIEKLDHSWVLGRVGIDLFEIRNQFCMLACSKNVNLITGTQ